MGVWPRTVRVRGRSALACARGWARARGYLAFRAASARFKLVKMRNAFAFGST